MQAVKTAPRVIRAAGSHSLTAGYNSRRVDGPFDREELYPVFELEAPRVGTVQADFEVSRYVHFEGWSGWRILLRDVREPADDGSTYGRIASGVGPATRDAIRAACTPMIEEWLQGDEYRASRQLAAARAIVRLIEAPSYQLERAQRTLEHARSVDLPDVDRACKIRDAIVALQGIAAELEEITS